MGNKGGKGKKHLVVLVHGLFGSDKHLANVVKAMETNFCTENIEIFVSKSNKGAKTLDGVAGCGDRLIEELDAFLASRAPHDFETISFIVHCIFITTPHFGCNDTYLTDIKKEDSVTPCLRWMGQIPVIGKVPAFLFHVFESFFVWLVLRKTGDDLFLRDKDKIVEQLASYSFRRKSKREGGSHGGKEGEESQPPPYLAALASFRERTCYGNIRGDHVVAWENATIRRKIDL